MVRVFSDPPGKAELVRLMPPVCSLRTLVLDGTAGETIISELRERTHRLARLAWRLGATSTEIAECARLTGGPNGE